MLLALGIILLVCALFLIVAVLLQQGKGKSLGGAISGSSSDTFYGKTKNSTRDKQLSKITTIVAVVFVLLVLVVYIVQDTVTAPSFGEALTGDTDHVHTEDITTGADTVDTDAETGTSEDTTEDDTSAA